MFYQTFPQARRIIGFSRPLLAFFAAALISSTTLAEERWEVSWDLPGDCACDIGVSYEAQNKHEQLPRQGSIQFSESEFITISVSWKRDYEWFFPNDRR